MKTFSQFCENKPTGSYVAVKYGNVCSNEIVATCRALGIPNSVMPEDLHTTIIYSRTELTKYNVPRNVNHVVSGELTPAVFETSKGKRVLVLKLNDEWFGQRHEEIMGANKRATYDFPDFVPHITLSYDLGDFPVPTEFVLEEPLTVVREYHEELDCD